MLQVLSQLEHTYSSIIGKLDCEHLEFVSALNEQQADADKCGRYLINIAQQTLVDDSVLNNKRINVRKISNNK